MGHGMYGGFKVTTIFFLSSLLFGTDNDVLISSLGFFIIWLISYFIVGNYDSLILLRGNDILFSSMLLSS